MTTRHVTYLTVKGVSRDGERWIEGWATTPAQDRIGDIVAPEGAVYSLPLPLLFAHKHDEPIGSVVEASVTRAGIRIRAKLTAGVARAEEVWKLIQDGALTAVSIGFQALKSTPLSTGGLRFDQWSWHELSVVSVPANPDARISVGKALCYAIGKPESDSGIPYVPCYDLDKDFARARNSLPPALRAKVSDLRSSKWNDNGHWELRDADGGVLAIVEPVRPQPAPQKQLAGSLPPEQFAATIGKVVGGHLSKLERRIGELECANELDVELLDTLTDLAKRLEEVEEHAWRHKGYWREGARAQRNEVYAHNGSSWICNRTTRETPCAESADWTRLARAGRDGRDAR